MRRAQDRQLGETLVLFGFIAGTAFLMDAPIVGGVFAACSR